MQNSNVTFKVHLLIDKNKKSEKRYISLNTDVRLFGFLQHKLENLFPSLKNKKYKVYWMDPEGEIILISSIPELHLAIPKMGSVKKLYIKIEGDNTVQHINVNCSECKNSIFGYRYKCVTCQDYDLCQSCEGKNCHSDHFMLRFPINVNNGENIKNWDEIGDWINRNLENNMCDEITTNSKSKCPSSSFLDACHLS